MNINIDFTVVEIEIFCRSSIPFQYMYLYKNRYTYKHNDVFNI